MQFTISSRSAALALVAMLAISMVAIPGALAAEPSVETSSDLEDDSTWPDFNASPDDNKLIEFTNTDAEAGALVVTDPDTGNDNFDAQTHLELDADDDEFEVVEAASDLYGFNITADQLETVPMEAGENKTVEMTIYNETDYDNDSDSTTISVTLDNTMERSVLYIGEEQIDEGDYGLEQTDEEPYSVAGFDVPLTGDQSTSLDTDRDIDGTNTTVYTYLGDDVTSNHFEDTFDGASDGDWIKSSAVQTTLDGEDFGIKSFSNELPDDFDLADEVGALTYDGDALVVEPGDEFEGEDEMELNINSDANVWDRFNVYGFDFEIPFLSASSGLLAGLFVVGAPRAKTAA